MPENKSQHKPSLSSGMVFIIPGVIGIFALFFKHAVGPYWLSLNNDPSYIYLLNALYLVGGISPIFIQHPGITLQLLMAGLIKLFNFSAPTPAILEHVFSNPEYYLNTTYFVLLSIYFVSLAAAGYYIFKRTKNILASLMIQSSAFLFLTMPAYDGYDYVLTIIANVNAETLLISLSNFYVIGLLKLYFDETKQKSVSSALWLGVICALGIMTKLAFLPLLLAAWFLLPDSKSRCIFIFTFLVLSFLLSLPISPRYGQIYHWIKGLIVYDGVHGSGNADFINPKYYMHALGVLIKNNWYIFALSLSAVFIAIYYRMIGRKQRQSFAQVKRTGRFLFIVAAAVVIQFLMVAKQPSTRYLVAAVAMSGLLLFLLYEFFRAKGHKINSGVVGFLLVFMSVNSVFAYQYKKKLSAVNQEAYDFSRKVFAKYKDCIICPYYRSSSIPFALEFADDCSGFKGYAKILKEKYPAAFFYHFWGGYFHDFTDVVPLKELMKSNPCVLLYGQPYQKFPNKFLKLQQLEWSPNEAVYKVLATTADEAVAVYLLAKKAELQKKYKEAYILALQAQALGFPRLDEYIAQLKSRIHK